MPRTGIHSVTIPGTIHGWVSLLEAHGTLPLSDLLRPAIQCAEEGFPVGELTSNQWKNLENRSDWSELRKDYLLDGKAPRPGDIFSQPNLARTLRQVAEGGVEAFYRGKIAEKIVQCSQKHEGLFTLRDLSDHSSEWVKPITTSYRGYEVFELPPATQGVTALELLKILEGYDLQSLGHNSADYLHLLIESKKLVYCDRDHHLADRDFMKVKWEELISESHIKALRSKILMDRACPAVGAIPLPGDTEYIAVADREGNLVSFIQSLYNGFGSGIIVEDTGIILQNRGSLFSLEPNHANCIAPHKRCFHTLMPAMVFKGADPFVVLGLKGGHVQPQVQVQLLVNLIDFRMTVGEALTVPRFNHLSGLDVALESDISAEVMQSLAARGHRILSGSAKDFGGAHAILVHSDSGVLLGGADFRKDGCAIGY